MSSKVSVVSYINSYPFVYGLEHFKSRYKYKLDLCEPSQCAKNVLEQNTDIALIPAGALPDVEKEYTMLPNFCIGAQKSVSSVLLLSNSAIKNVNKIYLDTHSITSVKLVKLLAKYFWNIQPEYVNLSIQHDIQISEKEAVLIIGDKCFDVRNKFAYVYDMFDEWQAFTNLPFVFAVWVAKKQIDALETSHFEEALAFGIAHKEAALELYLNAEKKKDFAFYVNYISHNINYFLDNKKQEALSMYLNFIKNID